MSYFLGWKQPNCSKVSKAHAFSFSRVQPFCVLSGKATCFRYIIRLTDAYYLFSKNFWNQHITDPIAYIAYCAFESIKFQLKDAASYHGKLSYLTLQLMGLSACHFWKG